MKRTGRAGLGGRASRLVAGVVVVVALQACGGPTPAPAAGDSRGVVPDLAGVRVMVLPVQRVGRLPGDVDAELAFALPARGGSAHWILPEELRRAAAGAPGMDVSLDDLPVGVFLRAEVRRIGDPLYGNLRRLAALTDGDAALIPVAAVYRAAAADTASSPTDSAEAAPDALPHPGRVEVTATLLEVRSGRVLWFGVVGGEPGPSDDPAVLATAMDALARRLARR